MPTPSLPVDPIRADDPKKKKKEDEPVEDEKGKGKANGSAKEDGKEEELVCLCFSTVYDRLSQL